jgi:5-methylcytosine-specific restriction endonuclease McrA
MPYKDPVRNAAYIRDYKRQHRDRYRWRDKVVSAALHANKRAARFGVEGRLTADDVDALLRDAACHYCGSLERLGLDHVVPMAKGGPNEPPNIVPACRSCNARKSRAIGRVRWADDYDRCVSCGGTDRRHSHRGLCVRCASNQATRRRRARQRDAGERVT